jgi:hypothetical protein
VPPDIFRLDAVTIFSINGDFVLNGSHPKGAQNRLGKVE